MSHILVTGSSTGLGRAAAEALLDAGHDVVVHIRSETRRADVRELTERSAAVVIGDLSTRADVLSVADQVTALGPLDVVIHNAGIYVDAQRVATTEGHARTLAVNVLAPYMLTALLAPPSRLIYLSSGMHRGGDPSLRDIDWRARRWSGVQAYSDSKLFVTTFAAALARRWPTVCTSAVDPGWVPTRMGGPGAPDDLVLGHTTQTWLATSDDPAATVTGQYWYHQHPEAPASAVNDTDFQDALLDQLDELTGVALP